MWTSSNYTTEHKKLRDVRSFDVTKPASAGFLLPYFLLNISALHQRSTPTRLPVHADPLTH